MIGEKYTEPHELMQDFPEFNPEKGHCGAILYNENGKIYVDPSESHILVDGRTGMGKSLCISTPFVISNLLGKECVIIADPKGEIHERTVHIAQKSHKVIVINLRDALYSKDGYNPLMLAYYYYKKGDAVSLDLADTLIMDLAFTLYPLSNDEEPYWIESSRTLFSGLVRSLFEKGDESEITLDSIANMCEVSEETMGSSTVIKKFSEEFEPTSIVRRQLSSYANAPRDTRGSTHVVAANGISIFGRNNGLIHLLSEDTIDIAHLDVDERPLAVYIIIPDEVEVYDQIACVLIKQLTTHFIRLAHDKYNGRLPCRVNIILEEVSIIGKSIPNLDRLLADSRSRNIRMMLITQNAQTQLSDLYGKSKAASILSCIGLTYAFSNNDLEAMAMYSARCGCKCDDLNGLSKDLLISPTQLSAMGKFTALVLIENRYKYIYRFSPYYELFPLEEKHDMIEKILFTKETHPHHVFDLKGFVEQRHKKENEEMFRSFFDRNESFHPPFSDIPSIKPNDEELINIIDEIDGIDEIENELDNKNDCSTDVKSNADGSPNDDESQKRPSIDDLITCCDEAWKNL